MGIYSKLDGTAPISHSSAGVWKILKKRKTGDRKRRNEKRRQRGKEEQEGNENILTDEGVEQLDVDSLDNNEQIGYGSVNKKNMMPRKIDLKI